MLHRVLRWFGDRGDPGLWYTVQCDRCGEEIRVRVDRRHEARWEAPEGGAEMLVLDKDVLGARCPNLMRLHLEFDDRGRVSRQRVESGELVE